VYDRDKGVFVGDLVHRGLAYLSDAEASSKSDAKAEIDRALETARKSLHTIIDHS
tara:strand:- start:3 stop:167 length:165 start_codon:yes stop_codon:yes gene_type:complete